MLTKLRPVMDEFQSSVASKGIRVTLKKHSFYFFLEIKNKDDLQVIRLSYQEGKALNVFPMGAQHLLVEKKALFQSIFPSLIVACEKIAKVLNKSYVQCHCDVYGTFDINERMFIERDYRRIDHFGMKFLVQQSVFKSKAESFIKPLSDEQIPNEIAQFKETIERMKACFSYEPALMVGSLGRHFEHHYDYLGRVGSFVFDYNEGKGELLLKEEDLNLSLPLDRIDFEPFFQIVERQERTKAIYVPPIASLDQFFIWGGKRMERGLLEDVYRYLLSFASLREIENQIRNKENKPKVIGEGLLFKLKGRCFYVTKGYYKPFSSIHELKKYAIEKEIERINELVI